MEDPIDEEAVILRGEPHRRHKMILTSEQILFVAFCLLFAEVLFFWYSICDADLSEAAVCRDIICHNHFRDEGTISAAQSSRIKTNYFQFFCSSLFSINAKAKVGFWVCILQHSSSVAMNPPRLCASELLIIRSSFGSPSVPFLFFCLLFFFDKLHLYNSSTGNCGYMRTTLNPTDPVYRISLWHLLLRRSLSPSELGASVSFSAASKRAFLPRGFA